MRTPDKHRVALAAILAVAVVVRFWGIGFGLPHTEARPDESTLINVALGFFTGDLNPHYFNYGTLWPYLLFLLFGAYYLFGRAVGWYASLADFAYETSIDPTNLYLLDRVFAALLGVATVLVVYLIARELFDRRIALTSSGFLAFAYLHARDSHFGVTDVPMTFMIAVSFLFVLKSLDCTPTSDHVPESDEPGGGAGDPRGDARGAAIRNYALAALFAGLATSTKYAGVFLLAPMDLVHRLNLAAESRLALRTYFDRRILTFLAVFAGAFLLGTPFALLDFGSFVLGVFYEVAHLTLGERVILSRGWFYHPSFSLPYGLGWPLFVASIAGIPVLARQDARKANLLMLFPLVYYVFSGMGYTVFVRYTMPLVPFLCISAAVFTAWLGDITGRWMDRAFGGQATNRDQAADDGNSGIHEGDSGIHRAAVPRASRVTTPLLVVLVLLPSLLRTIEFDRLLTKTDNRVVAADWIRHNVPQHSAIYQSGFRWGRVQLPRTLEALQRELEQAVRDQRAPERRGYAGWRALQLEERIARFAERGAEGYETWVLDAGVFEFAGRDQTREPDYIIIETSPLVGYSVTPESVEQMVRDSYTLLQSFEVTDAGRPSGAPQTTGAATMLGESSVYDQQDAFYVPYAGFEGVERPGPSLHIYQRQRAVAHHGVDRALGEVSITQHAGPEETPQARDQLESSRSSRPRDSSSS